MNATNIEMKQEVEQVRKKIIDLLSSADVTPLYEDELMDRLKLTSDEESKLNTILNQMVEEGQLVRTKKKKYAIPEDLGFLTGRLQGNARGFGFFIHDKEEEDVFIPAESLNGAMHNDRILIRLLKGNGLSREGEVIRVLERANKTIVGTFEKDKNFGFVIPDDKRIN
jgi:ribonuclease R